MASSSSSSSSAEAIGTPTDDGAGSCQMKEDVADLMECGSKAFGKGEFDVAAEEFEAVAVILVEKNAKSAAEYVQAKYRHGLALLALVHMEDDLMTEAVPMERDYLLHSLHSIGDGSTIVAKQAEAVPMEADYPPHDGIKNKASAEELQKCVELLKCAESVLLQAWRRVKRQPTDTMEQVDILSALGEVALKKGNWPSAYEHYLNARCTLQRLVEEDNPRIAHLFKEASAYCKLAISGCKDRIERLTNELKSSSGLANVNQEPSSLPDEVAKLEMLLRAFAKKVPILRLKSSTHSTPGSSSSSSHK